MENNGVFDSGEPARAVDYSFTFERGMNGTYDFVCEPHASAGMVGQIVVEPAPPLNETNATEEAPPMSENTPSITALATASMLSLAWVAIQRRQGNG